MNRRSTIDWEKDIYAHGRQVNRYPYDAVVSYCLRKFPPLERANTTVLEIGCGTANNLAFLLDCGFDAWGIDSSQTAVRIGNEHLKVHSLAQRCTVGDLTKTQIRSSSLDLVLDRACLTQNDHDEVSNILSEMWRILKPGGYLASFDLFGEKHPDRDLGTDVGPGARDHFSGGVFAGVGLTSFFNVDSIRRIFRNWILADVQRHLVTSADGKVLSESFFVEARKPESE